MSQPAANWSHYEDLPQNEQSNDRFSGYWRVTRQLGASDLDLIVLRVAPGEAGGYHSHAEPVEEAYMVLEGEVDLETPEGRQPATPGTVWYFPPGAPHRLVNNSGEDALVVSVRTLDDGESKATSE